MEKFPLTHTRWSWQEEDGSLIVEGLEMSESGMFQCFCYNAQQITQSYMPVHVKSKSRVTCPYKGM